MIKKIINENTLLIQNVVDTLHTFLVMKKNLTKKFKLNIISKLEVSIETDIKSLDIDILKDLINELWIYENEIDLEIQNEKNGFIFNILDLKN
jgi:hypothetical protein